MKYRYSPKEALGIMIIANENVSFKEFNNLVLAVEQVLVVKKDRAEILENIDISLISKIDRYWEMKKSQVIAYAYLVFNHFRISSEDITPENITENFIYQMEFFFPDNAIDFVKKNFSIDLEKFDNKWYSKNNF